MIIPCPISNGRTLVGVHWFSGLTCIGIVIIENEVKARKAYIGVAAGGDEVADATAIANYGSQVYPHQLSSMIEQLSLSQEA